MPACELHALQKENVDSRKSLNTEFAACVNSPPPALPAEVVKVVFDELALIATQPYEYVPDVLLGPRSSYMDHVRFQKGLTLVCKSWWDLATRVLYERIVIRRMGQIPALARTLSATDAGYNFGSLVKHITLHECAILKPFSDVVLEHLRIVLRHCTTLQSFSMVPHYNYRGRAWYGLGSALDNNWMALETIRNVLQTGRAETLRHLELSVQTESRTAIVELYHLLSQTTQLLSLKLVPFPCGREYEAYNEFTAPQMLTLPSLNDLQISMEGYNLYEWIASSWQLPNLTFLTFLDFYGHISLPFLAAHGGQLIYLHCYPSSSEHAASWHGMHVTQHGFDQLADVAPMLEHLVVCKAASDILRDFRKADRPLVHLRHLDVWVPHVAGLTRQRVMEESFEGYDDAPGSDREKFPALGENVRFLSHRVHGHSDLPKICHPSALSQSDEVRALYVRDVCVVQTSWCVWANEVPARIRDEPGSDTADSDEEEDPEFVAGDDEEDKTSWCSEDASDHGSETGSLDGMAEDSHVMLREDKVTENGTSHQALLEQWDLEEIYRVREYLVRDGR
ncbi:hypothetical protein K466DRAFT_330966 [Polyporus arcularius HHB13444]|uniref:F-box domain-containing protein n=1 Tax=Polyporus arcularius HHB13444 TaxID=1314778 RepID=A0A5C3P7B7_9APHY|nr:hypothetical protein K466DRAFT_330966 [Polyporus arcularius HHB13444]